MEKTATRTVTWSLPEQAAFGLKSGMFLLACGAILYVALVAEYPAVHDALHNVRHALAVVPCH
ncbi:MAG: CbtB domain-containing protein [Candidatus Binatia bacterium]